MTCDLSYWVSTGGAAVVPGGTCDRLPLGYLVDHLSDRLPVDGANAFVGAEYGYQGDDGYKQVGYSSSQVASGHAAFRTFRYRL